MNEFIDTRNISPLCQGCYLADFADKEGFDMHQCEECKKKASEIIGQRSKQ